MDLLLLIQTGLGHPDTVPVVPVVVVAVVAVLVEAGSDPLHTFLLPVGAVALLGHLGTLLLTAVLVQQADVETAGTNIKRTNITSTEVIFIAGWKIL